MSPMARSYGNGSVQRRGSRWRMRYYMNGELKSESCGPNVRTKADAQRMLRERMLRRDLGYTSTTATVSDLLDLYVTDQSNREHKAPPLRRVEVLRRAFGKRRAATLKTQTIEKWLAERRRLGNSGPTLNRYRSIFLRAYKLSEAHGMRIQPPYWPRMAESKPKRDVITPEMYQRMRAVLPEPFKTVLMAGWWTSCRRGELLDWKWEYLNAEAGAMLVPDSKSGEPRLVPLGRDLLGSLIALQITNAKKFPGCPWVFTWDGHRIKDSTFNSLWRRYRAEAGLPGLRFHALRHTAITRMRSAGVPESAAMAISGHKTSAVFRRYGIQPSDVLMDAMARLERLDAAERRRAETEPVN